MAWCHQATKHYLSRWWFKSMSRYGIRPRCFGRTRHEATMYISHGILYVNMILNFQFRIYKSYHDFSIFASAISHLPGSVPVWTCDFGTPLYQIYIRYLDILYWCPGLCNWLPLRCLVPSINQLPPLFRNLVGNTFGLWVWHSGECFFILYLCLYTNSYI